MRGQNEWRKKSGSLSTRANFDIRSVNDKNRSHVANCSPCSVTGRIPEGEVSCSFTIRCQIGFLFTQERVGRDNPLLTRAIHAHTRRSSEAAKKHDAEIKSTRTPTATLAICLTQTVSTIYHPTCILKPIYTLCRWDQMHTNASWPASMPNGAST
jgi:hypothetical protein